MTMDAAAAITGGRTALGIELGSTRIKAVLIGPDHAPLAIGVLNAFHEEGLAVPDDVSVVGFDDVPEAAYYTPPLTTVRQDFTELGRRGVQVVLARLSGEEFTAEPVAPQLVVRASTGPARVMASRAV